jgi:glycosyltransferase involved in cell wall biosynthesis
LERQLSSKMLGDKSDISPSVQDAGVPRGERDKKNRRFAFVSTPFSDPWSGAEELWALTAADLVSRGFPVSASVTAFSPLHSRVSDLQRRGVDLWLRPAWYSLRRHPVRRLRARTADAALYEVKRLIEARAPALVVFSEGNALPPLDMLELCAAKRLPFVTITHANKEAVWYSDGVAERYRRALAAAQRCFFVSEGNRRLSEKQIAGTYANAEIVHNPVNVSAEISLPWPSLDSDGSIRFAVVGRLYPPAKGQDLLFEALATPPWKDRPWRLYVYGSGEMQRGLAWLADKVGIADRVVFAGFARVEEIWASNHVLVMPSRFEGLPLAMVEAMLCGRPVIATDIAGHREIIEDGVTGFLADAPTAESIAVALERFWTRRGEAEEIGKAGARRIRGLVPPNPVALFSEKLRAIVASNMIVGNRW